MLSHDALEMGEKLYCERRISEKHHGKDMNRKHYSNNNSIIELQQVDDKRYVTCKTRVIPNSECSSPKIIKSHTVAGTKGDTEVSFRTNF